MKRNKFTAVILSIVMSMSMMMPSFEVMADETSAPSDTQQTETTENKEPKTTKKQEPKETETQEQKETEKSEPETTETQESKESETQETKERETQETKVTETQVPEETEKQETEETTKASDNKDDEATVEESVPPQTASNEPKNGTSASNMCGDALTWSISGSTLTISGSGDMYNFKKADAFSKPDTPWYGYSQSILSVVFEGSVTSIGSYAFYACENLTTITIPNSVTSIGNFAFYGCYKKLTSISIPGSVKSIGSKAFAKCDVLRNIAFSEGLESIGDTAFDSCIGLVSITIPNSVTKIESNAFAYCSNLTSITLSNSLTSISSQCFTNCTKLKNVHIPSSVTSIESGAFTYCEKITSITIPNSVISIGGSAFSFCSGITSIVIPNSVTSIGSGAFSNSGLTNITIPSSVTSISTAFSRCKNLISITLSNGLTSIDSFAFSESSNLTSITIPDGVTSIGQEAFKNCTSLTSITIPNSVRTINYSAFKQCTNLQDVYYYGTDKEWNKLSINIYNNDTLFNPTVHYLQNSIKYAVKVNNGSANPDVASQGTTVNLTADSAPSGKVFDKWMVDAGTVSFSNASSSTTTFTMPDENVEVTATYKDVEYTIKVNNGSATSATATVGMVINLTADAAPSGKVFDKWVVDAGSVSLSNVSSSTATFTMPGENVEVTATYKDVPAGSYIIKVNNGNGNTTSLISAPGLVVNVTANDAPAGTEFEKWEVVSGTVIYANASSETTFFVMPAENVEITAKYKSSLSVKGKTATVKYSKVKKKNQTLAVSKVLTFVDKGQGQLTYAKVSGNSKILINKTTGAITVKKKLKKKTYTVKVKVQASGNESCNPSGWKTVTFKIKVK